ncbi:hypothetical protein MIR68_009886 [Amoeboaphelidium protococcarum]|nr:hypothetical protein MIR68_009886 [Amoeboaphelidium protococcarum]
MKYQLTTAFAALIASAYGLPNANNLDSTSNSEVWQVVFQRFASSDCSGDALGPSMVVIATLDGCTYMDNVSVKVSQLALEEYPYLYEVKTFNGGNCKNESAIDQEQSFPVVQGNYQLGQCVSNAEGSSRLLGMSHTNKTPRQ